MSDYWQDRVQASRDRAAAKTVKETEAQLRKYYNTAMKRVIRDFEATYDKLMLTPDKSKAPADLYKLSKYWEAQNTLKKELQRLGDKEVDLLSKRFVAQWKQAYKSAEDELLAMFNARAGGDPAKMLIWPDKGMFNSIATENMQQIINGIWCADGKQWSTRIWQDIEKLAETLNDELVHCVVTGGDSSALKMMLQERFSVSFSRADALVQTEIAHIQTEAAQQRYKDYGIDKVQFWAEKDAKQCDECEKLHKTVYDVGTTGLVPRHPRCRCCLIPYIE